MRLIEHPPVFGGRIKTVDDKDALAVRGVTSTVKIDTLAPPYLFKPLGGVAVIANSTWAAFQGRKKLKVTWDEGATAQQSTASIKAKATELFAQLAPKDR